MGTLALIGLGSNLGDRRAHLDGAIAALAATPGVRRPQRSARITRRSPSAARRGRGPSSTPRRRRDDARPIRPLLDVLQAIEAGAGRVRTVRWGERTLDLDLLLFGDLNLDSPRADLPHPRMPVRRFVLAPLAEIAPEAVDPRTGRTVSELLANLDRGRD